MLVKNSKTFVACHKILVGSANRNNLFSLGYTNLVGRTYRELDFADQYVVKKFKLNF